MDVHRTRFVQYAPAAIAALAFDPSSSAARPSLPPGKRLAVGRGNGDIEIWKPGPFGGRSKEDDDNSPDAAIWSHESTIKGGVDRSVEGLTWAGGRLFSIGHAAAVTEWDLCRGRPLQSAAGGGEVWCLAAQPTAQTLAQTQVAGQKRKRQDGDTKQMSEELADNTEQYLVAGCADGSLALLSIAEGSLEFARQLSRATSSGKRRGGTARCLSVCWQGRNRVVAGFSDSTIRVFEVPSGKLVRAMNVATASGKHQPKETLVWSVATVGADIASGDSQGNLCIWSGLNYGLLHRIQGHEADILCIAASGNTLMSGGLDRRISTYNHNLATKRWEKMSHWRAHAHDVKAIAVVQAHDEAQAFAVSGGVDGAIVVTPVRERSKAQTTVNHRTLPLAPQLPVVNGPAGGRWVFAVNDRGVSAYKLHPRGQGYTHGAQVVVTGDEHVGCAAASTDLKTLVVCTAAETKWFRISENGDALKVKKLDLGKAWSTGARLAAWSPNSRFLLLVGNDNAVRVVNTAEASAAQRAPRPLKRSKRIGVDDAENNGYLRRICRVTWSHDSTRFAVADLSGWVDVFETDGAAGTDSSMQVDEPSDSQSSNDSSESDDDRDVETAPLFRRLRSADALPRLPGQPLALGFRLGQPGLLLAVAGQNRLVEYDVDAGQFSDWTRQQLREEYPLQWQQQKELAVGMFWDGEGQRGAGAGVADRVWVWAAGWLARVDLTRSLGADEAGDDAADDVDDVLDEATDAVEAVEPAEAVEVNGHDAGGINGTGAEVEPAPETMSVVEHKKHKRRRSRAARRDVAPAAPRGPAPALFMTHRYRNVLGMVPLGGLPRKARKARGGAPTEVCIVELGAREWLAGLPARVEGGQAGGGGAAASRGLPPGVSAVC